MKRDTIEKVEILEDGRLIVKPASEEFPFIYRAAMEVNWDPETRCLYSPKPREWTYPQWFGQICGAAITEYDVWLLLTSRTQWVNIPVELQSAIADPEQWKDPNSEGRKKGLPG